MGLDFSIVIPTYNCGTYLERALRSAIEQAPFVSRIIVVDDGSTDHTCEVVEAVKKAEPSVQLQYIYQAHQGPFIACEQGISRIPEDGFVVFLDADDRLRPGYLEAMNQALSERPQAALAFGQVIHIDGAGHHRRPPQPRLHPEPVANFRAFVRGELELAAGGGTFARRIFEPWLERSRSVGRVYGLDRVIVAHALACYEALVVPAAEAELHDRPGRLRNDVTTVCANSLEAVDVLFDSRVLPAEAMQERSAFRKRLLLEQAVLLYRARRYDEAAERYRRVWADHNWLALGRRHRRRHLVSEVGAWFDRVRGRRYSKEVSDR